MKPKKPTRDERAAEKAFERWWNTADRYNAPYQLEWPAAFLAGVKHARRADIAAVRRIERQWCTGRAAAQKRRNIKEMVRCLQGEGAVGWAIDAIKRRGRE